MFYKATEELKKIRKFTDYRKIDTADYPGISQMLDDISYQLTIIIKDMMRIDEALAKGNVCITEKNTMPLKNNTKKQ